MKSDYSKVFDSLSKCKSLKAHFNALNKIYESTKDGNLKDLLSKALSDLMDSKYLKNSTPILLSKSDHSCFTNLLAYCKKQSEQSKNKKKELSMPFPLEWYLNQIVIIVATKMGIREAECYSPFELNEFIQRNVQVYEKMRQFIAEYTEWYNYHKEIEEGKVECDALYLTSLSDKFKQTRHSLLMMAESSKK